MTFLIAVLPSLCLAVLFWWVMRAVFRADRTEREAVARFDRERLAAERDEPSR